MSAVIRRLDAVPQAIETDMTTTMDQGSLTGRRILVVEDTYFIADDVAQALRSAGATVVGPAPDRERAMALLASEQVDAAVLDINLGGALVFPLADALLARGLPFLFATGYDGESLPPRYADAARISKPVVAPMLTRALATLLSPQSG